MSKANSKTLEIYEKFAAQKYIENNVKTIKNNPEKFSRKRETLKKFVAKGFENLPKSAEIFEIGSGSGDDAVMLRSLGFSVTPSDVSAAFLSATESKGFTPIKFNVLIDDFQKQYDGIFCWRTFVHFDEDDTKLALSKIYSALKPKGVFIFNMMNNIEKGGKNEEWVDFEGEHHIGAERYYKYWDEKVAKKLIKSVGFKIVEFDAEEKRHRWFNIVAQK